jgi:peptidoglycan/xylan/chitin deacetylase (PgdA/CDA1 family)
VRSFRGYLRELNQTNLQFVHRRSIELRTSRPIVSFTFDDFPLSAYTIGSAILESYNARGTYYVAPGLMNTVNAMGEHFREHDLHDLLARGHELGCHTYSHISCRSVPLAEYKQDVLKGRDFFKKLSMDVGGNYAFPFGHVTIGAKKSVGQFFLSCRGTFPGINNGSIDLNLLNANKLYSDTTDFATIERLIASNKNLAGWLIFYTHDIRDNPSSFGSTPEFFKKAVKLAVDSGANLLTVGAALTKILCKQMVTDHGISDRNSTTVSLSD